MAENRAEVDKDAETPRPSQSSPAKTPKGERRFSAAELQADARPRLGVSPATVAGAMVGRSKETYTLDEAERLVNEFLDREIVPS